MCFASKLIELHWLFSGMVLTYLWTENVSEKTIPVFYQILKVLKGVCLSFKKFHVLVSQC